MDLSKPVKLSCDTLGDLDGGIARLLIDREIEKAVNDLADRGEEDGKPRKINMTIELTLNRGIVVGTVAVDAKLPPRVSGGTAMKPRAKAGGSELIFQPGNAENPDQPTLEPGEIED